MKTLKRFMSKPLTKLTTVVGVVTLVITSMSFAAVEVGEVGYSRGVLTGKLEGEGARLMGKGQGISQGETLSTGKNSFAIIELNDGTRMTLRPNTVFRVEELNTNAGEENALLSLIKGGFRAITGSISKKLQGAFKVNTGIATIGIRGTEFDARLCTASDCDEEDKQLAQNSTGAGDLDSSAIARVVRLNGNARASSQAGRARALTVGSTIFEQERLNTGIGSYIVVAFNDESRITMTSNSELLIKQHNYAPEQPAQNNSVLEFVRGGLRLLSGVIGKLNPSAYSVETPVATIGIRGTGFDLLCRGQCGAEQAMLDAPVEQTVIGQLLNSILKPGYAQSTNSEMFARVWNGAIELKNETGSLLLGNNQAAVMQNAQSNPRIVSNFPSALETMENTPRPDEVPFQPEWFKAVGADGKVEPGLYVQVKEGIVAIKGLNVEEILLAKQEAGKVNLAGNVFRLNSIPGFQRFDKYPRPGVVTRRLENLLNLMGEDVENINEFECVVQ